MLPGVGRRPDEGSVIASVWLLFAQRNNHGGGIFAPKRTRFILERFVLERFVAMETTAVVTLPASRS